VKGLFRNNRNEHRVVTFQFVDYGHAVRTALSMPSPTGPHKVLAAHEREKEEEIPWGLPQATPALLPVCGFY
jgi:hypothetical protein